tara:strand:+ start:264 stop:650 length:387 start_codon:yes stop_codon:yes gene_type:complete
MNKIDYSNKHGIMIGYSDNGNVPAVELGWECTPEKLATLLLNKYPTKEDAITLVDSPVLMPSFRKDSYWGVDSFGDVIESNLSWNKEEMRKNVGHLFCHMTGVWKYSDNGIDWTPIREEFAEEFKEVA